MNGSRSSHKLLLAAGMLVVLAAVFARPIIPLYDGVNFPDEQYRYVVTPAGQKSTAPVTTATRSFSLSQPVYGVFVQSGEQGAQVYLYIDRGFLEVPSKATAFTVTAQPLAPSVQPADGTIAGNVYRVTAASDAGPVTLTNKKASNSYHSIDLRLPQGFPAGPTMEYKPEKGAWSAVSTTKVGSDIYEASLDRLGDYALVMPRNASVPTTARKTSHKVVVVAVLVFLIMVIAVVVIRIKASKPKLKKKRK